MDIPDPIVTCKAAKKKNGGNAASVDCPARLSSAFLSKELRIRSMGTLGFVLSTFNLPVLIGVISFDLKQIFPLIVNNISMNYQ